MRNLLRLYFEFAFRLDNLDVESSLVANTNDLYMEIDDDSITDERLLAIYHNAVMHLEDKGLRNFCLLPTLFMRDDIDIAND